MAETCVLDKMILNSELLVNTLLSKESHVEFHPCILPKSVSKTKLMNCFEFLSPILLILHGSTISRKKFSTKKNSDLDIVCLSLKAAFWPLTELYEKIDQNLKDEDIKIDVTIITYNELLSILDGSSSLGVSFSHGFSILFQEGDNELQRSN